MTQPCPAKSSAEMRLPSNVLHAFGGCLFASLAVSATQRAVLVLRSAHRARGLVFDTAKRLKDLTASGVCIAS